MIERRYPSEARRREFSEQMGRILKQAEHLSRMKEAEDAVKEDFCYKIRSHFYITTFKVEGYGEFKGYIREEVFSKLESLIHSAYELGWNVDKLAEEMSKIEVEIDHEKSEYTTDNLYEASIEFGVLGEDGKGPLSKIVSIDDIKRYLIEAKFKGGSSGDDLAAQSAEITKIIDDQQ